MEMMKAFWIHGFMPVQFLLVLVSTFFLFVVGHALFRRIGRPLPVLAQAVLIWLAAYVCLKFIMYPPLPISLLYTYMGLISIVIFLLISTTEKTWTDFKYPILATLSGETKRYRQARRVVFVVLPVLTLLLTYSFLKPDFTSPTELRNGHPAPPRSITVHGQKIDLQTVRNPFRVDG